MQFLNGSYTGYFNRRHRRAGHLFQGRYKSQLVEEEGYYLEVSRYIHLNPVRARCVERPEQYRWGSYPGYHNPRRTFVWTTYKNVLGEFGRDQKKARAAYRQFVAAGVQQKPVSPFSQASGGLLVGGETFLERISEMLRDRDAEPALSPFAPPRGKPSLQTIRAVVAEEYGVDSTDWAKGNRSDNLARAVAAHLSRCQDESKDQALARWVRDLNAERAKDLLLQLLSGDTVSVKANLLAEARDSQTPVNWPTTDRQRSLGQSDARPWHSTDQRAISGCPFRLRSARFWVCRVLCALGESLEVFP